MKEKFLAVCQKGGRNWIPVQNVWATAACALVRGLENCSVVAGHRAVGLRKTEGNWDPSSEMYSGKLQGILSLPALRVKKSSAWKIKPYWLCFEHYSLPVNWFYQPHKDIRKVNSIKYKIFLTFWYQFHT